MIPSQKSIKKIYAILKYLRKCSWISFNSKSLNFELNTLALQNRIGDFLDTNEIDLKAMGFGEMKEN